MWGAAILAAGLLLSWIGMTWGSDVVQALAITTAAAGAVAWLFGATCLRAAAFPVAFLLMMAPLPRPVVAAVTLELQSFAASFAAATLRLVGIPVFHVGATLELSRMTLQVAEVCNGLRFLMAIIVLTAAFAQIKLPRWRRRVLLIASTVPIAIVANAIRVAAIGAGVHYVGPEAASGTIHDWIGKGVWVITLLPMIGLGVALARFRRTPRTRESFDAVAAGKTGVA
jgi:exosortase